MDEKWYEPETDLSEWKDIEMPGYWEDLAPELAHHDGAVWFRRTFDLPEGFSGDKYLIALNQLDDYDIAWVNGVKVGETFGRHNFRNYFVDAKILKPVGNVLVVRIVDTGGEGGFSTSAFWGNALIRGTWKYRKGMVLDSATFPKVSLPNVSPFSSPGVLFNSNIAPLTHTPIKGVIWYQGESNADRAYEYRGLFPTMIQDWRRHWGQGDFPFLFVQLANYREEPAQPQPSSWAELREAQTLALQLPNTGMAVAIDIGEAGDIHPRNKVEVGRRLCRAALRVLGIDHGQDGVGSGPLYASHRIEGDRFVIWFEQVGSGLMTPDKYGYVRGFEMAGKDSVFHWAQARIEGETVEVFCEAVSEPVAVRYGWADNPGKIDLYNAAGLPASPFRTDDWPGMTKDKKFDASAARF
jgi:sialate O-acetylesterase